MRERIFTARKGSLIQGWRNQPVNLEEISFLVGVRSIVLVVVPLSSNIRHL